VRWNKSFVPRSSPWASHRTRLHAFRLHVPDSQAGHHRLQSDHPGRLAAFDEAATAESWLQAARFDRWTIHPRLAAWQTGNLNEGAGDSPAELARPLHRITWSTRNPLSKARALIALIACPIPLAGAAFLWGIQRQAVARTSRFAPHGGQRPCQTGWPLGAR